MSVSDDASYNKELEHIKYSDVVNVEKSVTLCEAERKELELELELKTDDSTSKEQIFCDESSQPDSDISIVEEQRESKKKLVSKHWICYFDAVTNKHYYYEPNSKETVWELPEGAVAINSLMLSNSNSVDVHSHTDNVTTSSAIMGKQELLSFYGLSDSSMNSNQIEVFNQTSNINRSSGSSSHDYAVVSGFNACGHSTISTSAASIPVYDRSQKQMDAFFECSTLSDNREEYKRMKIMRQNGLGIKRQDWKSIKEEQKAKKQRKEWNRI